MGGVIALPLKIISKKDGFRRCGVAHPAAPVIYPDGTFTPEQVERLKSEPMLIVEEIPGEEPGGKQKSKGVTGPEPGDS